MTGLNTAKCNSFITQSELALFEMNKKENISPVIAFELEFLGDYGAYSNNQIIEDCGTDCTVTDDDIERELNCDCCSREYCSYCCSDCDDYSEPEVEGHEWTTTPMTISYMLEHKNKFDDLSSHIYDNNGYVNENCGGHIHISNISDTQISRLITYLATSSNDTFSRDFGRIPNNWCKVSSFQIACLQRQLLDNCKPIFDEKSMTASYAASDIVRYYQATQEDRYFSLNILNLDTANPEANHIEWRLPSGTIDSDELYQRVLTLANILNGTDYSSLNDYQTSLKTSQCADLKQGAKEQLEKLNDALISTENIRRNIENDIAATQALINSTITAIQIYQQ